MLDTERFERKEGTEKKSNAHSMFIIDFIQVDYVYKAL